ncbi:hypothetical protein SNE40_020027 [Patella caerulea]|uniref:Uncharacterized protein n=1 Tax=Patella caerulea TaxID=87958 RepID=A0AAN8IY50_PATCE
MSNGGSNNRIASFDHANDRDRVTSAKDTVTDEVRITSKKNKCHKKSKTKARLDALELKLDRICQAIEGNGGNVLAKKPVTSPESCRRTEHRENLAHVRTANTSRVISRNEDSYESDGILSIKPLQQERIDSDDTRCDVEMPILSRENDQTSNTFSDNIMKKGLFSIFGKDALTKKEVKNGGIKLDDSQREVLSQSWRAVNTSSISAFPEENLEMFPIDEETRIFLQVPTMDDMIEACLIQKHGSEASFAKSGRSLYKQPYRAVEKVAYRGQQAAFMGINIQLYIQQALVELMQQFFDNQDVNSIKEKLV